MLFGVCEGICVLITLEGVRIEGDHLFFLHSRQSNVLAIRMSITSYIKDQTVPEPINNCLGLIQCGDLCLCLAISFAHFTNFLPPPA